MCPPHDESILFTFINDITKDQHCENQMLYDGMQAPRNIYVLSVIAWKSKSTTTNMCECFQISTSKIHDVATPLASASQYIYRASSSAGASMPNYSLLGFALLIICPLSVSIRWTGKPNIYAFCVIPRRKQNIFHILKSQCLEPKQIIRAINCFPKLRTFCKRILPINTEKNHIMSRFALMLCRNNWKKLGRFKVSRPTKTCNTLRRVAEGGAKHSASNMYSWKHYIFIHRFAYFSKFLELYFVLFF